MSYFDTTEEQIRFVVNEVKKFLTPFKDNIDFIGIEGLSLGSIGNQVRNLAGVYHTSMYAMVQELGIDFDKIHVIAPTSLKVTAREYLPDDIDKVVGGKKVKMDKSLIIKAAENIHPEALQGLVKSSSSAKAGKEDISDAIFAYYSAKRLYDA